MGDEPRRLVQHWRIIGRASLDADLARVDIAVLWSVLQMINGRTGRAFTSLEKVAQRAQVSVRSVPRSLKRLCDAGYLVKLEERGANRSSIYSAGHPDMPVTDESDSDEPVSAELDTDEPAGATLTDSSVQALTGSSDISASKQLHFPTSEKPRAKRARTSLTFHEWCQTFPKDAELIDQDHAVFRFAARAKIPPEFMDLAWEAFHRLYGKGGLRERKRYTDWPRVVQNAIEGDWLRIWRFDQTSQQYVLTTAGLQLQQDLRALDTQKAA